MSSNHPLFPQEAKKFSMFINGKLCRSSQTISRKSPSHFLPVSTFPEAEIADLDRAVLSAKVAFEKGDWSRAAGSYRAECLNRIADKISARQEELALVESLETGKPISQARGEMGVCVDLWKYAACLARTQHGDSYNSLGSDKLGLVLKEPVGVVGIITPWNFPFLLLSERMPFALAAGCTVVLKPSEITSGTTLMLGEILAEDDMPAGVVNLVSGGGKIGQAMAEHRDLDMISFTGSTVNGKKVMKSATDTVKRVGLELGGKNPMVVFSDADLDGALDGAVFSGYFNAGQCCISTSRLIVEETIVDEFIEKLVAASQKLKVAETLEESTQIGSIVNDPQLDKILGHVKQAREDGAVVCCGGEQREDLKGRFISPTVIKNVSPNMALMQEEVFGPVIAVTSFKTADEAIQIANGTTYGLSGSVWTKDVGRGLQTIRQIRCGKTWLNSAIEGYPEMPLGGMKQSGLGRETGRFGMEEYTELKTVLIQLEKRNNVWL